MDAAERVAQELREDEQRKRDAEVISPRLWTASSLRGFACIGLQNPLRAGRRCRETLVAIGRGNTSTTSLKFCATPLAEALGTKAAEVRGDLTREINLLKREFAVLQGEVAAANKLRAFQEEIMAAKAAVPQVPTIVADFEAKQTAMKKELRDLKRELATAKDKIADLNVEVSQSRHVIRELEKQPRPLDQQTAEILRECARQWVAEQQEPPSEPPPMPFHLPPLLQLEHTNGQATNNG